MRKTSSELAAPALSRPRDISGAENDRSLQPTELYTALEAQYFGENMHEKDEIERLPELLKDVSVFVDVGASLGQYSFFANKILKNGRIYCIEADSVRVQRLIELASEWEKLSTNKITVIHAAAAEKDGKVTFFRTDANMSGGIFVYNSAVQNSLQWTKCEVDSITLDSLCKDLEPDLIKIDVEGSEYSVLQGACRILTRGKCRFFVEVHPWGDESAKKTPADVFRLFARFGYDFKRTHRHWLFQRSNGGFKQFVKSRFIVLAMENAWLKSAAKSCALKLQGLKRIRPH
jgi:FkbM family methyltransferase